MSTGNFSDEFADAFALDDIDPSKIIAGGSMLPEGYYRLGITQVVRHDQKTDNCCISCEVLEAVDPKLVGREHTEYLPWPDRNKGEVYNRIKAETLLAWCMAGGAVTEQVIAQRKAERKGFDPAWLDALVGVQVIGRVDHEEYEKKDKVTGAVIGKGHSGKLEKRVWRPNDPKIAGVLASIPKPAGGQQQGQQSPAAKQTPPTPDPMGDLPV